MRGTLAQRCVDRGLIRRRDLERALGELRRSNERFSSLLAQLDILPESRIVEFFAEDVKRDRVRKARDFQVDPDAAKSLDQDLADRHGLVPLQKRGNLLIVASCGLPDPLATDDLRNRTGLCIVKEFCSPEVYRELRGRVFGNVSRASEHVPQSSVEAASVHPAPTVVPPEERYVEERPAARIEIVTARGKAQAAPAEKAAALKEEMVSAPGRHEPSRDISPKQPSPGRESRTSRGSPDGHPAVDAQNSAADDAVGFVQSVLNKSVEREASDIHIEPTEKKVCVRYRVDGVMEDLCYLPKDSLSPIVSRIKILSNLDIAERRAPQDGGLKIRCGEREIEFRVSTLPGIQGETVVLRVLDPSAFMVDLDALGFSPSVLAVYEQLIHRPHGVLLVTGPTGSGKTTTLYSTLSRIHTGATNIVTVEDPVEYRLEGINQTQINPKAGVTFASSLRSILRQDPDVIMVGEMRDKETAETAIRSSLTGHMVLSTLHTNDASSAFVRLVDMGIAPYLVASSVSGVVAQRLVRILCPKCKEGVSPPAGFLEDIGADIIARWRDCHDGTEPQFCVPRGCVACRGGFRRRLAIFELAVLTERIKKLITTTCSADEMKHAALDDGMISLWEDGVDKVLQGLTTYEEICRTVARDG